MTRGGPARMFVALMLGEELGEAVAEPCWDVLAAEEPNADGPGSAAPPRAVDPRDLHLTLFFLGAVERSRVRGLERALAGCVDPALAPDLVLRGTGAFPGPHRPRVLWVGVEERGAERLAELQGNVQRACRGQGFATEGRPFHPHVTVARVPRAPRGPRGPRGPRLARGGGRRRRGEQDWVPPGAFYSLPLDDNVPREDPGIRWQPEAVWLVESVGGARGAPGQPRGPAYRPVSRFPFRRPLPYMEDRVP